MKTADLMTRNVTTLTSGSSVFHAARLMHDRGISGLPVVDDAGNLVGIVTEGDLLRRVEPNSLEEASALWKHMVAPEGLAREFVMSHSWRVADVMTSPVVTVSEDTALRDLAELLLTRGIKRVPVMRNGRMVGIISRSDLLNCIANEPQKSIPPGDDAILLSVRARLRDVQRVLSTQPEVTVEDGVVHLWGKLGSQAERDTARVVVEGIPGIAGFEDHTRVASS